MPDEPRMLPTDVALLAATDLTVPMLRRAFPGAFPANLSAYEYESLEVPGALAYIQAYLTRQEEAWLARQVARAPQCVVFTPLTMESLHMMLDDEMQTLLEDEMQRVLEDGMMLHLGTTARGSREEEVVTDGPLSPAEEQRMESKGRFLCEGCFDAMTDLVLPAASTATGQEEACCLACWPAAVALPDRDACARCGENHGPELGCRESALRCAGCGYIHPRGAPCVGSTPGSRPSLPEATRELADSPFLHREWMILPWCVCLLPAS